MAFRIVSIVLLLFLVPLGTRAATLVLPRTGQSLCYDGSGNVIACAGTGQDGETQLGTAWPNPRFTDNLDGTITDDLSGLIWLKNAYCTDIQASAGSNMADAISSAKSLHSGQCELSDISAAGDWRLPNVNELESLTDLSQANPALPQQHPFGNVQQTWYWTSTVEAVYPNNGLGLRMDNGTIRGDVRDQLKIVWPVRGVSSEIAKTGQSSCWDPSGNPIGCSGTGEDGERQAGAAWPAPRFLDNGDGTISDQLTGLLWLKKADCFPVTSTQGAALATARTLASGACNLNDGSAQGSWRLPNRKEIRSLIDFQQVSGSSWLTNQGFSNVLDGWYCSSDSFPGTSDKWLVKTEGGTWISSWVATLVPAQPQYLLPVRNFATSAVVTPGNLNQAYDGTPKGASATTIPAGLTVSFTYNGSSTAPTGAGSYTVLATITDAHYQGSASGTLVIAKASAAVTLGGLNQTYDGTPKGASATTIPAGLAVSFSYNGSSTAPTGAGSYTVLAAIADANYQGSASGTVVIAKASAAVTMGGLNQTYDGTPKGASATTIPVGLAVSFTYNGSSTAPTDAGDFTVLAAIADANYQGSASGTVVIAKASAAVMLGGLNQTYDGTPKGASATTVPAGLTVSITYNGGSTQPIEAGTYLTLAIIFDANYTGTAKNTLTVQKAIPSINWAVPDPIVFGTALSAAQLNAITSVPGTFAYSPGLGSVPAAGTQILSTTFTPTIITSYTSASATVSLTVLPVYMITFLSGGNGVLSGAVSQLVNYGSYPSEVSALPSQGYHFVKWSGADGFISTDNPLRLGLVTASQTLTATFAINTYSIKTSATGNGTISCTSTANYGANFLCTITPATGFHLFALTDNELDSLFAVAGSSYTGSGVTADHLVSATFGRPDGILNKADGKVTPDLSDALAVYNRVTGATRPTTADLAHGDIAPLGSDGLPLGDGKLDIYDVIGILEMIIGVVQP